jgi:peroxiredoxin
MDLQTSDSVPFDRELIRNKVVLLDFWATWCRPCQFALPAYAELHKKHQDAGLQVVAVSVDHDPIALARYLKKHPMPFPILSDAQGRLASQMGVTKMPSTFLIDRSGVIRAVYPGFDDHMLKRLSAEIEELLSQP